MEFDYYADHSIAAAAVVAYADVGGVVARYEIKAFYRFSDLSAKELNQRFKSAFFCLAEYFIQTMLSGTHAFDELIKELEKRDKN